MPANTWRFRSLDKFRNEWVCGHLDYQRAADALEVAERRASDQADDDAARHGEVELEAARRHLAQVQAELSYKFDLFCGVAE